MFPPQFNVPVPDCVKLPLIVAVEMARVEGIPPPPGGGYAALLMVFTFMLLVLMLMVLRAGDVIVADAFKIGTLAIAPA